MPSSPLVAYRIGDCRHKLLDGRGAMLMGGRWNSPGNSVIYASLSQAGAMLEVMAQANIGKLPCFSEMIVIEIPSALNIEVVNPSMLLGWDHLNNLASRSYGDDWIACQRSVALLVPSVLAPRDRNIVINQMHPDFLKIVASPHESIQWDQRLFNSNN